MAGVLIVEDEIIVARQLEEYLTRLGYRVVGKARNGHEAIRLARKLKPDLILMDIVMPGGVDGIEASREITRELDVPVIFITAHTEDRFLERAGGAEAFGYVVKPFGDGEIKASIELALLRKRKERKLKESREEYRALIRDAGEAMLLIEARGKIVEANRMAERLLGYSREELGSLDFRELYPKGERGRVNRIFKEILRQGQAVVREMSMVNKAGKTVPIEVTAKLIYLGQRKVVQVLFRDISARKKEEHAQLQRIKDLEKHLSSPQAERPVLPICARCKKIRDRQGGWQAMEYYLRLYYRLEFTHSLCPECTQECYKELEDIGF